MTTISGGLPTATSASLTDKLPTDQVNVDSSITTRALSVSQILATPLPADPTTGLGAATKRYADWKSRITQPVGVGRPQTVSDGSTVDTTSNSLKNRVRHVAPTACSISDIVISHRGFGFPNPETDNPTAFTAIDYIEYPVGTFTQVYSNGAINQAVAPGRAVYSRDPSPLVIIPAGAIFYTKSYLTWTPGSFTLHTTAGCQANDEWTVTGTSISNDIATATTYTNTNNFRGYAPTVQAIPSAMVPCIGIIGCSHENGAGDTGPDIANLSMGTGWQERGLRGQYPLINLSRGGESISSLITRTDGRFALLRNRITHLYAGQAASNDIFGGLSAATTELNFVKMIAPFLAKGIPVGASTVTPRTTSTDYFTSAVNQTLVSAPYEAQRLLFNAWLRTNWQSLGLAWLSDDARLMDPTDSGKWSYDAGAVAWQYKTAGFPVMSGGTVTSVGYYIYQGSYSNGVNTPLNTASNCIVYTFPGDTGTPPVITCLSTATGFGFMNYTVVSGGSGLLYPPMITPLDSFTYDGTHKSPRGHNEQIKRAIIYTPTGTVTGFGPSLFAL